MSDGNFKRVFTTVVATLAGVLAVALICLVIGFALVWNNFSNSFADDSGSTGPFGLVDGHFMFSPGADHAQLRIDGAMGFRVSVDAQSLNPDAPVTVGDELNLAPIECHSSCVVDFRSADPSGAVLRLAAQIDGYSSDDPEIEVTLVGLNFVEPIIVETGDFQRSLEQPVVVSDVALTVDATTGGPPFVMVEAPPSPALSNLVRVRQGSNVERIGAILFGRNGDESRRVDPMFAPTNATSIAIALDDDCRAPCAHDISIATEWSVNIEREPAAQLQPNGRWRILQIGGRTGDVTATVESSRQPTVVSSEVVAELVIADGGVFPSPLAVGLRLQSRDPVTSGRGAGALLSVRSNVTFDGANVTTAAQTIIGDWLYQHDPVVVGATGAHDRDDATFVRCPESMCGVWFQPGARIHGDSAIPPEPPSSGSHTLGVVIQAQAYDVWDEGLSFVEVNDRVESVWADDSDRPDLATEVSGPR